MERLTVEAARYLVVGTFATMVALLVFNVLVHGLVTGVRTLEDWPVLAVVISNLTGMMVSYLGNRTWTFRLRTPVGPAGGMLTYYAISGATMLIPVVCLSFSRYVLGRDDVLSDNIAANVIGLGLAGTTRFLSFRRFVFVRRDPVEVAQ